MKKLLLVLLLLLTTVSFSQDKSFTLHAYSITITQHSNGAEVTQDIDMDIKLNDYYVMLSTGRYWKVSSNVIHESTTSFYVYGIDSDNGSRARLWFKTINGVTWGLTISYSDYSFFYLCTLVE